MTSSSSPRLNAGDRVAPKRAAAPKPAARAPWLLPSLIAAAAVCVVGGGLGAFYLMPGKVESTKQRISAIKLGPLPDMPDLRDGVPALMPKASPAVTQPASAARAETKPAVAPPKVVEDANRKAMESTIASTVLRPAIATTVTTPAASAPPSIDTAPAVVPREAVSKSATPPAVVASAQPVRQVEIKPVRGATGVGGVPAAAAAAHLQAAVATAPLVASAEPKISISSPDAVAPQRSVATPQAISSEPATESRTASPLPAAPLPPRRPSFGAAEPAGARPAQRAQTTPRVAAATRAPAAPAAQQPAAAPAEERSLLGVPVPGFIPSGRDIRDAASSITNAVTSLPSRF